jgi:hypothetical protein
MSAMNALPIGIPELLAGRPDTQVTAKARLSSSGDRDGGGAEDHPGSLALSVLQQPVGGGA